jgi:glycosyltransferase involved in cell wall biosynthesis
MAYRLYKPWEQALLRRAQAVIATSRPYADSSAALAPWREKVRVVPLGLPDCTAPDATTSTNIQWPASSLRLLAVGRLSYFKGFDVLLRALAQVPAASLVLVGDGECGAALRALARELGVEARVRFAGRLDMDAAGQAQLESAYANADVFCLPSTERAESFGIVLLEAMRARLPAIASDIPGSGAGFVVRDGETGLLVAPGDADALATAIRRLADDAALRKNFGAAGGERFRREFTLDRVTPQVSDAYRHALNRGMPGPVS